MTINRIDMHVAAEDRIQVRDQTNRKGASLFLGSETIIHLCPEAVARLQSALTRYVEERAAPPTADILRMPQGRARSQSPSTEPPGAA